MCFDFIPAPTGPLYLNLHGKVLVASHAADYFKAQHAEFNCPLSAVLLPDKANPRTYLARFVSKGYHSIICAPNPKSGKDALGISSWLKPFALDEQFLTIKIPHKDVSVLQQWAQMMKPKDYAKLLSECPLISPRGFNFDPFDL